MNPGMVLPIVNYGHPALRAKGRRIDAVDAGVRQLVADLLETMVAANGVGLAAQQVGVPVQVCVVDITGVTDRPSAMWVGGKEVDPEDHMPMVLINPAIQLSGRERGGTEGCLSFPGMSGEVTRPEKVRVQAMDLEGRTLDFEASGLLARAVQHEFDHLQGVLFIDRMSNSERKRLAGSINEILAESAADLPVPPRA
jgi:peptide deformylase